MTPQIARNAITFLERTDIKGNEAESMMQAKAMLLGIMQGVSVVVSKPKPLPLPPSGPPEGEPVEEPALKGESESGLQEVA